LPSHDLEVECASITLQHNNDFLKLYSLTGNDVIPLDRLIPIQDTLVGSVFRQQKLEICKDNQVPRLLDCQWLAEGGLLSCKGAPLMATWPAITSWQP
jgi:hypothetical protein